MCLWGIFFIFLICLWGIFSSVKASFDSVGHGWMRSSVKASSVKASFGFLNMPVGHGWMRGRSGDEDSDAIGVSDA